MGPDRHGEDPHEGPGQSPKLIVVGRLAGTLDGRPWSLEAAEQTLTFKLAGLTSLLAVRRSVKQLLRRVAPAIPSLKGRVRMKLGQWPTVYLGSVSTVLWLLGVDRAGRRSPR